MDHGFSYRQLCFFGSSIQLLRYGLGYRQTLKTPLSNDTRRRPGRSTSWSPWSCFGRVTCRQEVILDEHLIASERLPHSLPEKLVVDDVCSLSPGQDQGALLFQVSRHT